MTIDNRPSLEDVQAFTDRLAPLIGYEQQGARRESRVTLLVKPGVERMLDLEGWEAKHKVEDHPPVSLKDGTVIHDSNWELVNRRLEALRAGGHSEGDCSCGHPHEAHAAAPRIERRPNVQFRGRGEDGPRSVGTGGGR
jgi:hypothetical protein